MVGAAGLTLIGGSTGGENNVFSLDLKALRDEREHRERMILPAQNPE